MAYEIVVMDSQLPSMAYQIEGMDSQLASMADLRQGMYSIKKSLFNHVIHGNWQEVVEIFEQNPEAQDTKITMSGETALHIAVSEGNVYVVRQLVGKLGLANEYKVLRAKNERGNTPLHLAAALGTVSMCNCIAENDPDLISIRNNDGETPLFSAVLNGKTKAFLCLHEQSPKDAIYGCSYCRRTSDGDSILHSAIFQEYFGLAYQIIDLYRGLVHMRNAKGQTPLHVLATKPSAFMSGSRLGIDDKIIYHWVSVDPLVVETLSKEDNEDDSEDKRSSKYPYNYRTCVNFFWWLMMIIIIIGDVFRLPMNTIKVLVRSGKNNGNPPDLENPDKASREDFSTYNRGSEVESSNATQNRSSKLAENINRKQVVPPNYENFFSFFKFVMKGLLNILGFLGFISEIQDKKLKHTWAIEIMDALLEKTSVWEYDAGWNPKKLQLQIDDETMAYDVHAPYPDEYASGTNPKGSDIMTGNNNQATNRERNNMATDINVIRTLLEEAYGKNPVVDDTSREKEGKRETPLLLAAKYGVAEMVEKILDKFPVAIHDSDLDKKNVVLLAVENRQPHVYILLRQRYFYHESVFRKVDNQGNSALHLAATLGKHKPLRTPGAALQMQWELKWYKFVKDSMPRHFFVRYNNCGLTPKEVFNETHKKLVEKGVQWLNTTSQSCSLMAALIATVAFTSSSTVPGGVKQESGTPTLEGQPVFNLFAITSLLALCFSVTSLIMFLAILTSRYQEKDFASDLPNKLIIGLGCLFISIVAMLISFCSGHFFVVKNDLKYATYPLYAVACLPILFFSRFPFYFDLIMYTFLINVPQRSSR